MRHARVVTPNTPRRTEKHCEVLRWIERYNLLEAKYGLLKAKIKEAIE